MASDLELKLSADLKEVKLQLIELIKICSAMSEIVKEHERRSTNLEARIVPIEGSYVFAMKLMSAIITLGAIATSIMVIKSLLH